MTQRHNSTLIFNHIKVIENTLDFTIKSGYRNMGIIDTIIDRKRQRLDEARAMEPLSSLRARAEGAVPPPLDFTSAITRAEGQGIRLIAELKKASPSKGLIRDDFDPAAIAGIYDSRAQAISVLTEEDFFSGSLENLSLARSASGLPLLRKDFIFDPYQIYEARAGGADAILLIAMALEDTQAGEYMALARELGLGVLFEVHDMGELERALELDAPVIGINNRDLGTLEISLETTFRLKDEIPPGHTVVSESGISTRQDVLRLQEAAIDAMLIGTTFMNSPDVGAKVDELLGRA